VKQSFEKTKIQNHTVKNVRYPLTKAIQHNLPLRTHYRLELNLNH